jgi:hypothetical protein
MHASAPADLVTEATAQESAKLRRHFGRFDVLFFLICTIVGLDTIGSVATNGAQGFTWLLFLGIFFFAPYALLTAELGSAFPAEGGPYVWTRLAFGRFSAAVNSVIYWAANPIWLGGLAHHHRRVGLRRVLHALERRREVAVRAGLHLDRRLVGHPVT